MYTPDRGSFECVCDAQVYADTIRCGSSVGRGERGEVWRPAARLPLLLPPHGLSGTPCMSSSTPHHALWLTLSACPQPTRRVGGEEAARQWAALEREMAPLQAGAALFPAAAIRGDVGMALTAARYGPGLLQAGLVANKLTGPFSGGWMGGWAAFRGRQRVGQLEGWAPRLAAIGTAVTGPWLRRRMCQPCMHFPQARVSIYC